MVMQHAVALERKNYGDLTDPLPELTNLEIIYCLNGDKKYSAQIFESCVERWLKSQRGININALPYFYNFLVTGNKDAVLFEKAADVFLNSICPQLNSEQPFYQSCDILRKKLQKPEALHAVITEKPRCSFSR